MPPDDPALLCDSLAIAASLKAAGYAVKPVRVGPGECLFEVAGSATTELRAHVQAFYGGQALVSPIAFDAAKRDLKRGIDSALGRGRP